jgi:hypothetical protein
MSGIIVISIQWFLQDYTEPLLVSVKEIQLYKSKSVTWQKTLTESYKEILYSACNAEWIRTCISY